MLDPALEHVLRGSLVLLLATGAASKARDLPRFRAAVEGYEIVPPRVAGAAALGFALAEAALAVALGAPIARGAALVATAALFALYAVAIAVNLGRGRREIDCGCGGAAAHVPLSGWLLARNAGLVAMALACRAGTTERALGLLDGFAIAAAIAVLACLWIAVHGLLAHEAELHRMQEDV